MEIALQNLELLPQVLEQLKAINKKLENTNNKRWMTTAELSKYLGYSKDRIYKLKGIEFIEGIHFFNNTGKILFDRVAIDEWVTNKKDKGNDVNQSQGQIVDNILSSVKTV